MVKRSIGYYLTKIVRISGWVLLPTTIAYTCSGYVLCGTFGPTEWLAPEQALAIHKWLNVPFVALALLHVLAAFYLAMRRWRWIGKKTPS